MVNGSMSDESHGTVFVSISKVDGNGSLSHGCTNGIRGFSSDTRNCDMISEAWRSDPADDVVYTATDPGLGSGRARYTRWVKDTPTRLLGAALSDSLGVGSFPTVDPF